MIKKIAIFLCTACLCGMAACKMGDTSSLQSTSNSEKVSSSESSPYVWTDESDSKNSTDTSTSSVDLDSSSDSSSESSIDNSSDSSSESSADNSSDSSSESSVDSSSDSFSESSVDSSSESSSEISSESSSEEDTVYVITLNANGGEVSTTKIEVKHGEAFTLPTPKKFENHFLGWKIKGTNTYLISGVYEFEEDIELVADWNPEWSQGF